MTVKDFGAFMRGLNARLDRDFASMGIVNQHSAMIKKLADDEAMIGNQHSAKIRRLMDENVLLKARLAKLESAMADLQKITYPLRPRAVKAEPQESQE